jgi:hypothetical protein
MLEELPGTSLINKELCSITPILSLIGCEKMFSIFLLEQILMLPNFAK